MRDAEQVLETAVAAAKGDSESSAICITAVGEIRVVAAPIGWTLSGLAAHHGADTVYLVEQRVGQVRVEGWSRGESCVLVRELPGAALRHREHPRTWRIAAADILHQELILRA